MSEGNGKPADPKLTCVECGKMFDPAKQKLRTSPDYNLTTEGVKCKDGPSCRGRQLHAEFEKRGLKRWSRHTAEQLLAVMDCPPKDWDPKKEWKSIHKPVPRVLAAIEFFSTCYPVCLLYAVQVDEDGEPVKEYGEWKRHTTRSMAERLALSQSTVARVILYLKARHLLDPDATEDRLCLELNPKPLIPEERESLSDSASNGINDLDDLAGSSTLLYPARKILKDLRAHFESGRLNAESWAEMERITSESISKQKAGIAELKKGGAQTVLDAGNRLLSLLSRSREAENGSGQASSSSSGVEPTGAHEHIEPDDDDGKTPVESLHAPPESAVEELQAAGLGKGALAKLPSPRPVLPEPTPPLMVAEEFHRALASRFKQAGKPVPIRNQTAPLFAKLEHRAPAFIEWFDAEKKALKLNTPGGLPNVLEEFLDTPEKEPLVTLPGYNPMLESAAVALLKEHEDSEDPEIRKWVQEQRSKLDARKKANPRFSIA